MRCVALARSTGKRCGNDAVPGSPFCEVVQHSPRNPVAPGLEDELERALEASTGEADPLPGADPDRKEAEPVATAPEPPSSPEPTPSEPDRADFPEAPGPEPSGLDGIPEGPGPELEDVAQAGPEPERDLDKLDRVSPHLFREAREELDEGELDGIPEGEPSPSPRVSVPGPHSSKQVQRIIMPAIDRGLRAAGLEELEPEEASSGGEIISLWLNHYWESLDPENPNHMLGMWVVVVLGSRLAPRAVARVSGRARASIRTPSDNGDHGSSEETESAPQEDAAPGWLGGDIPS